MNISKCNECPKKVLQPDLFDDRVEVVGCILLTDEQFAERDMHCPFVIKNIKVKENPGHE